MFCVFYIVCMVIVGHGCCWEVAWALWCDIVRLNVGGWCLCLGVVVMVC